MFPIANESGKMVAFGGRALGDDLPKYLNSPETPIYTKSSVLYHLDRAKEAMRQRDAAVLVEGYMDAIAVARAGISNVVASCGTSLTETQVKLLSRFTRRIIVNYDPDTAGQAATERSLAILLEQDCDVRVLALPGGKDPDSFIRAEGAAAYRKLLKAAPPYLDYLIWRARRMGLATAEGKLRAVNFLMPFVQRIPDRLLRSEWASRISQQLRVDEPVLREALRRAASERRSEVKTPPGAGGPRRENRRAAPGANADGSGRIPRAAGGGNSVRGAASGPRDRENSCGAAGSLRIGTTRPTWQRWPRRSRTATGGCCSKLRLNRRLPEATWEEAESCLGGPAPAARGGGTGRGAEADRIASGRSQRRHWGRNAPAAGTQTGIAPAARPSIQLKYFEIFLTAQIVALFTPKVQNS